MESLLLDIKYSLRQFRRQPLFVGAVVGTLALAIGANTLLFAIANAAIFRALPYPEASRVVSLSVVQKGRDIQRIDEPTMRLAQAAALPIFESVGLYNSAAVTLLGGEFPERLSGAHVSGSFFDVLRTSPALGRTFSGEELTPGGAPVVLLSDAVWARRFGRSATILGQRIVLNDAAYEVIGVMPRGFRDPIRSEFWLPLFPRTVPGGGLYYVDALARLREGVSPEAAAGALTALRASRKSELPAAALRSELRVVSLHERLYGDYTRPLFILLASVACVLLIGCANVANLLLARTSVARGALAIRAAVGASRGRLFRQVLVESGVLAGLGAILGVGLAYLGLQGFRAYGPPVLARLPTLAIDAQVLLFTVVLSVGTGLLFGLAPAVSATRINPGNGLRGGLAARVGGTRSRHVLVIVQIAAAVVLTVGTALLAKSFVRFQAVDRGFEEDNVLTVSITLSAMRYADIPARRAFFDALVERLSSVAAVESVDVSTFGLNGMGMTTPWPPGQGGGDRPEIAVADGVGDRHFRTFGIHILDGRECHGAPDTSEAVINRAMAQLAFGDQSAIGRSLDLSMFRLGSRVVVGVAANQPNLETKTSPMPTIYACAGRDRAGYGIVALRVRDDTPALSLVPALRTAVRELDHSQPLGRVTTVEQQVLDGLTSRWFDAAVIGALSTLALLLALGGLYAVTAFSVAQRTREIGVRVALGADSARVMRLVLKQGLALTVAGLCLGLAAALPLARLVAAMLFDVPPLDPSVFGTVAVLVAAVGTLATLLPAWRASRVDPLVVLKAE